MFERVRKAGRRFFARPAGTRFHGRYLARRQQQGGLLRKVLILTLGSLVVLLGIVILIASGIYTATHQRIADWLQRAEQTNLPPNA